jgi:hypothetical protein
VSGGDERPHEPRSDESVAAGDEDIHSAQPASPTTQPSIEIEPC